MDFLEKLFEIENFGIYLIVVISILILLFVIVLISGNKDKRKRDLEKTIKLDSDKQKELEAFRDIKVDEATLEVVKNEEPIINQTFKASNLNAYEETMNNEINNRAVESEFMHESIKPDVQSIVHEAELENDSITSPAFNFNDLANSISKELEGINVMQETNDSKKAVFEDKEFLNKELPVIEEFDFASKEPEFIDIYEKEEAKVAEIKAETPIAPIVEEKKERVEMPKVFSSVFINRNESITKQEEKNRIEDTPVPVAPVVEEKEEQKLRMGRMELPKTAELPKKNENEFNNISG